MFSVEYIFPAKHSGHPQIWIFFPSLPAAAACLLDSYPGGMGGLLCVFGVGFVFFF